MLNKFFVVKKAIAMRNDLSKTAQPQREGTRMYLPGSATSATNSTVTGTPVPSNGTPRTGQAKIRLSLALVLLSLVAVTALVLGVLFAAVPLLAQPKHINPTTTTQKPASTIPITAQPTHGVTQTATTPTPTATTIPTQTPIVQGTTTIGGLTANPSHFAVQSDCRVDNGYRCTVTLFASQSIEDSIHWKASSDGITTKFSPASGKIKAGQQQQVIVYIYSQCPYRGTLIFSFKDDRLTLPVRC